MTETVNMTVGPNFGDLLVSIAREKIFYDLNPQKGVETIKQSLIGCTNEMAISIIIGNFVLITSEDGLGVDGVPYDKSMEAEHPRLKANEWAARTHKEIIDVGVEWKKCLDVISKSIIQNDGYFNVDISYKSLVRFIETQNMSEIIKDNETFLDFAEVIGNIKKYIEKSYKQMQVIRWLKKIMPLEIDEFFTMDPCVIGMLYQQLVRMASEDNDIDWDIKYKNRRADFVSTYLNKQREIDIQLSKEIQPVDINDKYDAGWLSPEGDYYALNGQIANMLHLQIADALKEKGVIPQKTEDKYKDNPDFWLEQHGWVKIHGTHIMFTGYEQAIYGMPIFKLTDIQLQKICEYGKSCCPGGIIQIGDTYRSINVIKLKMMDEFALAKCFSDSYR